RRAQMPPPTQPLCPVSGERGDGNKAPQLGVSSVRDQWVPTLSSHEQSMRYHSLLFLATLLPSSVSPLRAAEKPPTPEQVQFFEKQVRPLLSAHCFKCHGPDKQRGDLRLDSRSGLMTGGQWGAVIVPGKPSESLLIDAINYRRLEMPPNKRLSGKDVATLTEWVRMGAPWPGPAVVVQPRKPGFSVTDEDRKYWAFQPVRRPPTPRVEGVTHPIDAFVLEKLSDRGLSL